MFSFAFTFLKSSFCLNLLTRKNTYRGNRQYFVLSLSTKFLTRKKHIKLATSQSNFFLYQIFFLYLTKQEIYIFFLYLLYIRWWTTIFPLLDIKLCFSGLLVRNAKLVSFFFVRFYLSTKTKIQCRNETLYFPYTYIGFSAVFALVFLIFLV